MSIKSSTERFCYLCDTDIPAQCNCIKKEIAPINIVGIDEMLVPDTDGSMVGRTASIKRNEEEYRRIWNAAMEACAKEIEDKFDFSGNELLAAEQIRKLKK